MNHHFKFAIREMRKNVLIVTGSTLSLVIGILSVLLITVWVQNELSHDRFHSNIDQIYMTMVQQSQVDQPREIEASLFFRIDYKQFPEIKSHAVVSLFSEDEIKLTIDKTTIAGRGLIADSTFLDLFDFELLVGDKAVLRDPGSLILTSNMAEKLFGEADPLGQTLFLESRRQGYYKVAAIMKDVPSNSSMHFDFVVPRHSQSFWGRSGSEFLLVDQNFDEAAFEEQIKHMGRKHQQFTESTLSVEPFAGYYFRGGTRGRLYQGTGDIWQVYTLIGVAIVIMLVTVFNFTNLQLTLIISQMKKRGIKRIHGATALDFWSEVLWNRLLYAAFSLVLAIGLFELVKPSYLQFLDISQNFAWTELWAFSLVLMAVFMGCSLIFALVQNINRFSSIQSNDHQLKAGANRAAKAITTIQYVLATVLLLVTAVVFKQFEYMKSKDLGMNTENIVGIRFFEELPYNFEDQEEGREKRQQQANDYKLVKSEILKIPGVEAFSQGDLPLDGSAWPMSWKLSQSDFEYTDINLMSLEPGYENVFGLELIKGRFFDSSIDQERQNKVVLNRAAMEYWDIDDLNGVKVASSSWDGEDDPWTVIGVVEDFHYEHLSKKVRPLIMTYFNDIESEFVIRIQDQRFEQAMDDLEALFYQVNNDRPFEANVLENKLLAQYNKEKKLSNLFLLFTVTALLISSIGLFTFALYETRKRLKEIGIRKVVGASIAQITSMLGLSMVKWVALAFLVACPLGWYISNAWLANFANQTHLSWWLFAITGALVLLIALTTVIGQAYMAAKRNPVMALRHD